jgi:Tfp pilus assembly protein PilF
MMDVQLFGLDPSKHHLVNLLFHAANSILVYLVFQQMTRNARASFILGLCFAIHPLHVESIAWVAERKDLLSAFFWLLTMWSYFTYVQQKSALKYSLVVVFYLLGLLSKAMVVSLPLVLLMIDFWPLNRLTIGKGRNPNKPAILLLLLEKLPLFIMALLFCAITLVAQDQGRAVRSIENLPMTTRLLHAVVSYIAYVTKIVWPNPLAVFYPHTGAPSIWAVVTAAIGLSTITGFAFHCRSRHPWFLVGWLWFLVTLGPVIGIIQVGNQAMADRYVYLPIIGFFVLIAWGTDTLFTGLKWKRATVAVLTVAVIAMCFLSLRQVKVWRTSDSLYKHAIAVTTNNYLAHNNLGLLYYGRDELKNAYIHFSQALNFKPNYAHANNNMAITLIKLGQFTQALAYLEKALQIEPNYVEANNNMGVALLGTQQPTHALTFFETAIRLEPDFVDAHNNLGVAHMQMGHQQMAVSAFQVVLRLNPHHKDAQKNLQKIEP